MSPNASHSTLFKKKEPQGLIGIKNSWKYEKDLSLMTLLNLISVQKTITRSGIFFKPLKLHP